MTTIQKTLEAAFSKAIAAAFGPEFSDADPKVRASGNPAFGDYQADFAMSLSPKVGLKPRDAAAKVLPLLDLEGVAEAPQIAGPGFINVRLLPAFLASRLEEFSSEGHGGLPPSRSPETIVIDYSAPNVAKEMHVGHLRSTIIGDAISRVLEFQGNAVIRQNHLGDWGTQFGMLIEHIVDLGWDSGSEHSIRDLNDLYKEAKAKFDADPSFADRARRRVTTLQGGDQATLRLWRILIEESKRHFQSVYATLGVKLGEADYRGESFYNPLLGPTVDELLEKGFARESNGAICMFPAGFTGQDGEPTPLILRKSDGGYGYDTTDMTAIRYRIRDLKGTRLIYVTDSRQKQHFAMVFQAAKEAGWMPQGVSAEHVFFGSVLGEDGKPFKSRSGETVKLSDLLEEAVKRAAEIVEAKGSEFTAEEKEEIARTIGIGAVKYADLSNDRIKDYVFSWQRMLAFEGNTAPYLQNAYVRIKSIFRKAGLDAPAAPTGFAVSDPAERSLALKLLQFPDAIAAVARSLEPHRLCTYLYELAGLYHQFYETCPVLSAPDAATRSGRLALSAATAATLKSGLELLGIGVVERM